MRKWSNFRLKSYSLNGNPFSEFNCTEEMSHLVTIKKVCRFTDTWQQKFIRSKKNSKFSKFSLFNFLALIFTRFTYLHKFMLQLLLENQTLRMISYLINSAATENLKLQNVDLSQSKKERKRKRKFTPLKETRGISNYFSKLAQGKLIN